MPIYTPAPSGRIELSLYTHNAAVLSSTVHNNPNYVYLSSNSVDIPLPYAINTRYFALSATAGLTANMVNADWLGAVGAYRASTATGSSAIIPDSTAPFTPDMAGACVKHAHEAGATTETGVSIIKSVDSTTQLTIENVSGAAFANGHYYYIYKSWWIVPVTGIYLVITQGYFSTVVDQKTYYPQLETAAVGSAPGSVFSPSIQASGTGVIYTPFAGLVSLAAGNYVTFSAFTDTTSKNSTMYGPYTRIKIWLLQQTA